jgi:PDZ domain-containing protein
VAAIVVLVALAGTFVWSLNYRLNEYAITPGLAQPVGPLITVSGHPHAAARRTILLTDVYLTQLTFWQWVKAEIDPVHEELVSGSDLAGPNVPTAELVNQGYLQMYQSQLDAKAAAMRALRLPVHAAPGGVAVYAIATHSSVGATLSVADQIVGAQGKPVTTLCSLVTDLRGSVPGQPLSLRVERANTTSGSLRYGAPTSVTVPTPRDRPVVRAVGCSPKDQGLVITSLGTAFVPATTWRFPFTVSINTADIGGPSAGLAMTLGILDALSRVPITGTLRVAATGTIDPRGQVGDVGGVAEKTIAVEQAGATIFLVPPEELGVARRAASSGLTVVAVRSLAQAIAAIERLGGHAPVPIADSSARSERS